MAQNGQTAEFDMLLEPQESKKNGKTYHYVSLRVDGVGTGQLYVTKEQYDLIRKSDLKRGDVVLVKTRLHLWQGKLEAQVVGIERAA